MVMLAWDGVVLVDNRNWLNKKIIKKDNFLSARQEDLLAFLKKKLATVAGKMAIRLGRSVVFLLG